MQTFAQRLQALLLLLTILGGSFGLPLYDAVVYHSKPTQTQPQADSAARQSEATTHSQACALDFSTRCGNGIAPFADLGLTPIPSVRTTNLRPIPVAPTQTWLASTHSRAPPRSLS